MGDKPQIQCAPNGPYLVRNMPGMKNSKGEEIPEKPQVALCRCGLSANKPFCDGAHAKGGFKGDKVEGRLPDKQDTYAGKEITLQDNKRTKA